MEEDRRTEGDERGLENKVDLRKMDKGSGRKEKKEKIEIKT